MSEKPPVVSVVVTSERGVLLCERLDGPPPFSLPGGEWEDGESRDECGVREVHEETGLTVEVTDSLGERIHPRTGRTMHYLAARPVDGELDAKNGDPDEHASVAWYSLTQAVDLMPGLYQPVHEHLVATLG